MIEEPCWLEVQDIYAIHGEIIAESGGTAGILNLGHLDSTVNKPKNLYCYENDVTLYDLAASYSYGLIKNHCFIDGNKRIALIAAYTFLDIHGIEITASEVEAASFFLELAGSLETQEESTKKLVCWLEDNSMNIPNEVQE